MTTSKPLDFVSQNKIICGAIDFQPGGHINKKAVSRPEGQQASKAGEGCSVHC